MAAAVGRGIRAFFDFLAGLPVEPAQIDGPPIGHTAEANGKILRGRGTLHGDEGRGAVPENDACSRPPVARPGIATIDCPEAPAKVIHVVEEGPRGPAVIAVRS